MLSNRLSSKFSDSLKPAYLERQISALSLQWFPYGLISAVEGQTIFVAAVMHLKRKPGYWVSRGRAK
jgi:hypothetical protein